MVGEKRSAKKKHPARERSQIREETLCAPSDAAPVESRRAPPAARLVPPWSRPRPPAARSLGSRRRGETPQLRARSAARRGPSLRAHRTKPTGVGRAAAAATTRGAARRRPARGAMAGRAAGAARTAERDANMPVRAADEQIERSKRVWRSRDARSSRRRDDSASRRPPIAACGQSRGPRDGTRRCLCAQAGGRDAGGGRGRGRAGAGYSGAGAGPGGRRFAAQRHATNGCPTRRRNSRTSRLATGQPASARLPPLSLFPRAAQLFAVRCRRSPEPLWRRSPLLPSRMQSARALSSSGAVNTAEEAKGGALEAGGG